MLDVAAVIGRHMARETVVVVKSTVPVGSSARIARAIAAEAKFCELVLLARGFHFHFSAQDHRRDETLRKVLKETPRPIVVVPSSPFPDGPMGRSDQNPGWSANTQYAPLTGRSFGCT